MEEVKVGRLGPFPRVSKPVFITSSLLIVGFIIFGAFFTETAGAVFSFLQNFITDKFGWLFIILVNTALALCIYLAMSRYGDIRLGNQTERPQYNLFSWIGMLFSAGIGIGLVYWGTAEPLYHFMAPPMGDAETVEAAKQAMNISFMHWGLHAWAIYTIVALSLAYFHFRRGLPLSIRSTLYPLLGKKIYGRWGHTVDILAVFGTMFGVVTSLGLGVMQINSGLEKLFGTPNSLTVQFGLIAFITALAAASVLMGLDKGIKRLSDINIGFTIVLLAFMVILGPTLFIFDSFIENIGNYLTVIVPLGTWGESYSGTDWQSSWTIFYWAWWVSWAPFVGIFIARISRGRTIREFTLGVLLIPMLILFFWFTTFGGVAVHMELASALSGVSPGLVEAVQADSGSAIFKLVEYYPLAKPITLLIVVMIMLWFVTSSDSASFVIDMLTAGGDTNPPKIQRLFWATTEGVIAAILLAAGGLSALQAAAIVAGLPFALVVFVMMYALLRGLSRDRLILYRAQQGFITDESADHNSANEFVDEHLLKGPPKIVKGD
ncbi:MULTISPECIES: BCCT family transporter [unclassified Psychrobacter]|uniref:BCCT family transporter n=1 Tax=unclassified Psychrobacter TaxID=196806 RepID=UPI000868BC0D|nr:MULTISPECIES: BCCT family transporter [unclassified Psychrobacter]MDN3446720.1 BCCT family transporter [Psychrobacter sp. APC 3281]OEH66977.1 MAG: choline transporter [Psychrobacter sp. B29-1]PKG66624.1 choline transporter [Psychrobacter sp. Choline-02u-13]PKH55183.1 choline transporter [Psychrobacter sp. Choline-02u-9]TEW88040.1 BCCT family transporter [Psychrobacter sp. 230]|tara:strand:- start:2365 stop:4008 length:1644 start_codon:yes stop_codon:yes gene_type:complete